MRVCLFSERMAPPFDEGIKNTALHLARGLGQRHDVSTLTAFGADVPDLGIKNVPANQLLLSPWLCSEIRRFRPDLIVYVPTACATLYSFLRSRVLKAYGRGVPIVLLALQPRSYGRLARALMPRLRPELVLVQSETTRASLAPFGCRVATIPPGIEIARFRPVGEEKRAELRCKYGLATDDYVVVHVGHLNRERNVQVMCHLQRQAGVQAILVGSTSTEHDKSLIGELTQAGVRVIQEYLPDIAEVYQMADCYLFPVNSATSAIDVPLSVLEALACDLPVVTTRFGGLPALFEAAPGFRYIDSPEQISDAVRACQGIQRPGTREMVQPYAWPGVAERILDTICRETHLGARPKSID